MISFCCSSSPSIWTLPILSSGLPRTSSNNFIKCLPNLSIVPGSKIDRLYSNIPRIFPGCNSVIESIRSNLAALKSLSSSCNLNPANFKLPTSAFWYWKPTSNIGFLPGSLSNSNESTNISKGSSWCMNEFKEKSLICLNNERKLGLSLKSPRIASRFTKKPINPSISLRPRFAKGVPTHISFSPE